MEVIKDTDCYLSKIPVFPYPFLYVEMQLTKLSTDTIKTIGRKRPGISNGNRIEWSPIRSVNKIGLPRSRSPICLSRVWLQTKLNDTKSYYQLIIKITISEKRKTAKL